jgi:hypothetical protein
MLWTFVIARCAKRAVTAEAGCTRRSNSLIIKGRWYRCRITEVRFKSQQPAWRRFFGHGDGLCRDQAIQNRVQAGSCICISTARVSWRFLLYWTGGFSGRGSRRQPRVRAAEIRARARDGENYDQVVSFSFAETLRACARSSSTSICRLTPGTWSGPPERPPSPCRQPSAE